MCTVNVHPDTAFTLAGLLISLRDELARRESIDPESIAIGPVDLGTGNGS